MKVIQSNPKFSKAPFTLYIICHSHSLGLFHSKKSSQALFLIYDNKCLVSLSKIRFFMFFQVGKLCLHGIKTCGKKTIKDDTLAIKNKKI